MKRHRGFTLLELLVALSAAGLLWALLAMITGSTLGDSRKRILQYSASEERDIGIRMTTDLLSNAISPDPRDGSHRLIGSEADAVFIATPPQALADLGLIKVRLMNTQAPSGQWTLLADIRSLHDPQRTHQTRLFSGPAAARFGYVGPARGAALQTQWNDATRLPARVQVAMAGDTVAPPVLISVAPRRSMHGRCGFDSVSVSCR